MADGDVHRAQHHAGDDAADTDQGKEQQDPAKRGHRNQAPGTEHLALATRHQGLNILYWQQRPSSSSTNI